MMVVSTGQWRFLETLDFSVFSNSLFQREV